MAKRRGKRKVEVVKVKPENLDDEIEIAEDVDEGIDDLEDEEIEEKRKELEKLKLEHRAERMKDKMRKEERKRRTFEQLIATEKDGEVEIYRNDVLLATYMTPMTFPQLKEKIQKRFGGGEYTCYLYLNGEQAHTKSFELAGKVMRTKSEEEQEEKEKEKDPIEKVVDKIGMRLESIARLKNLRLLERLVEEKEQKDDSKVVEEIRRLGEKLSQPKDDKSHEIILSALTTIGQSIQAGMNAFASSLTSALAGKKEGLSLQDLTALISLTKDDTLKEVIKQQLAKGDVEKFREWVEVMQLMRGLDLGGEAGADTILVQGLTDSVSKLIEMKKMELQGANSEEIKKQVNLAVVEALRKIKEKVKEAKQEQKVDNEKVRKIEQALKDVYREPSIVEVLERDLQRRPALPEFIEILLKRLSDEEIDKLLAGDLSVLEKLGLSDEEKRKLNDLLSNEENLKYVVGKMREFLER